LQAVNRLATTAPVSEPSIPLFVVSGRTRADVPSSGERTVVERPPPGLGRGARSVPAAAVIALTALLVAVAIAYYVIRLRRWRKK
jgi:hypothetical protein